MFSLTEAGYAIAGISVFISIFSSAVRLAVTDMKRMKEIKEKLKENQAEIRKLTKSGDTKKIERTQKEMLELTTENMHMATKPMLFTIIPILLIFWWVGGVYGDINPTYNVTIVDNLPGNLTILEAKVSNGGNFTDQGGNKTLLWSIPKARSDTESEVSAELRLGSGDLSLLNSSEAVLAYSDENGTKRSVSSKSAQSPENALMTVKKDIIVDAQSNKVFYKVTYRNMMTNNVVFFPIYADVCVLFGVFHIHNGLDWLGWYLICTMIVSLIITRIIETYHIELDFIKKKQTKVN